MMYKVAVFGLLVIAASGCATYSQKSEAPRYIQLNDPSSATLARNWWSDDPASKALYQFENQGDLEVGVNLIYDKDVETTGCWLMVLLRNNSSSKLNLDPVVALRDADGFMLPALTKDEFIEIGKTLQKTDIPTLSPDNVKTGRQMDVEGAQARNAAGASKRARQKQEWGGRLIQLANKRWLDDEIEIPAQSALVGFRFFPTNNLAMLPIQILIESGDYKFEISAPGDRTQ